jgi:hypothetical protein
MLPFDQLAHRAYWCGNNGMDNYENSSQFKLICGYIYALSH